VREVLEAALSSGPNILVAGGTRAGKTTLLNCLAAAIPCRERVVTAEAVFELKIPLPDVVSMQCRQESLEGTGELKLRRLVLEAVRMRPVLDRCRRGALGGSACRDRLNSVSGTRRSRWEGLYPAST
jgi:Flp pilus assembly CpaF family ATPase